MHTFSGTYHSRLDKGRCFFPAAFRKDLPDADVAHLKVRVTENDAKYLEIYEDSDWKEKIEDLEKAINYDAFDYEKVELLSDFTGSAEDIEIELKSVTNPANVGRMMIPKKKLKDAGIENEVTFVGTKGMILVWDKEKYENRNVKSLKSRIMELKQQQQ